MSAPSRFVRLVLGEYGVEPALVDERPWERRAELVALNPAGTLPVLVTESGDPVSGLFAIMEYLDETRGVMQRDRRLMPGAPLERAEVRRLVDWFLNRLDSDVVRPLTRERVFKLEMPVAAGGGAPDSAVMRAARINTRQHLKYLNWLAGSRDWLAGSRITLADLAAAAAVSVLDYLGEIDWRDVPEARDWYSRIKSRPAFRPLLADRVRGVTPVSHYADPDF